MALKEEMEIRYIITTGDGKERQVTKSKFDERGGASAYASAYPGSVIMMTDKDGGRYKMPLEKVSDAEASGLRFFRLGKKVQREVFDVNDYKIGQGDISKKTTFGGEVADSIPAPNNEVEEVEEVKEVKDTMPVVATPNEVKENNEVKAVPVAANKEVKDTMPVTSAAVMPVADTTARRGDGSMLTRPADTSQVVNDSIVNPTFRPDSIAPNAVGKVEVDSAYNAPKGDSKASYYDSLVQYYIDEEGYDLTGAKEKALGKILQEDRAADSKRLQENKEVIASESAPANAPIIPAVANAWRGSKNVTEAQSNKAYAWDSNKGEWSNPKLLEDYQRNAARMYGHAQPEEMRGMPITERDAEYVWAYSPEEYREMLADAREEMKRGQRPSVITDLEEDYAQAVAYSKGESAEKPLHWDYWRKREGFEAPVIDYRSRLDGGVTPTKKQEPTYNANDGSILSMNIEKEDSDEQSQPSYVGGEVTSQLLGDIAQQSAEVQRAKDVKANADYEAQAATPFIEEDAKKVYQEVKATQNERAWEAAEGVGGAAFMSPMAKATAQAREMAKSTSLEDAIEKSVTKVVDNAIAKGGVADIIAAYVNNGFSAEQAQNMAIENIATRTQQTIFDEYKAQRAPKGTLDYIMSAAMHNSIVGSLAQGLAGIDDTATQLNEEAIAEAGEKEGMLARVAGGVGSLVLDAPAFAMGGGIGGAVSKGATNLLSKGAAKMALKASGELGVEAGSRYLASSLTGRVAQASIASGTTLGAYDAMAEGARQFRVKDLDLGAIVNRASHGFALGAMLGPIGQGSKYLSRNMSARGKMMVDAGAFVTEAEVFNLGGSLLSGEKIDASTHGEGFVESALTLLAMKGTHLIANPGGLKASIKARYNSPDYPNKARMTAEDLALMKSLGYDINTIFKVTKRGEGVKAEDGAVDVNAEFANAEEVRNNAVKSDKEFLENYANMMKDANVPMEIKAKLALRVEGKIVESLPKATGMREIKTADGRFAVETLSSNGEVITRKEFSKKADADKLAQEMMNVCEVNSYELMERAVDATQSDIGLQDVFNKIAAERGADAREIANEIYEISRKKESERTPEDQALMNAFEATVVEVRDTMRTSEDIKSLVERTTGLNVEDILKKSADKRTLEEVEALAIYRRELLKSVGAKTYEAAEGAETVTPDVKEVKDAAPVADLETANKEVREVNEVKEAAPVAEAPKAEVAPVAEAPKAEVAPNRVSIEDVIELFGRDDASAEMMRKDADSYADTIEDLEADRQEAVAYSRGDGEKPIYWDYWKERDGLAEPVVKTDKEINEVKEVNEMPAAPEAPKAEETAPVADREVNKAEKTAVKPESNRYGVEYSQIETRTNAWNERTGVTTKVVTDVDAITNNEARAAITEGRRITGWYEVATGDVVIYAPNVVNMDEVDKTYVHEVVSHKGINGLLGEKYAGEFYDKVYNDVMNDAERERFNNYAGVGGIKDEKKRHRVAAEEYVANLAEKPEYDMTAEERITWQQIVEYIRTIINKILGNGKLTHQDIKDTLRFAYQKLRYEAEAKRGAAPVVTDKEVREVNEVKKPAPVVEAKANATTLFNSPKKRKRNYKTKVIMPRSGKDITRHAHSSVEFAKALEAEYADAPSEVRDLISHIAPLDEYIDAEDAVYGALGSKNKLILQSDGVRIGVAEELGLPPKELQKALGINAFASRANGGVSLQELAERVAESAFDSYDKERIEAPEVRNMLIEAIYSVTEPADLAYYRANRRIQEAQKIYDEYMEQERAWRDEWESREDAYEAMVISNLEAKEKASKDLPENYFDNKFADELNENSYGQSRNNTTIGRGNKILHEEQIGDRRGIGENQGRAGLQQEVGNRMRSENEVSQEGIVSKASEWSLGSKERNNSITTAEGKSVSIKGYPEELFESEQPLSDVEIKDRKRIYRDYKNVLSMDELRELNQLNSEIDNRDEALKKAVDAFLANKVSRQEMEAMAKQYDAIINRRSELFQKAHELKAEIENQKVKAKTQDIPEEVVEELNAEDISVDTENGDARVRFSVRFSPDKSEVKKVVDDIAQVTGRSKATVRKWVESEMSLTNFILDEHNAPFLDYKADDRYTAIKTNSDYKQGTVDFNNICRKRADFTVIIDRLHKDFPSLLLSGKDMAIIRGIMKGNGMEVACGLCYVEDRRQLMDEVAQSFINGLNDNFATYATNQAKEKVANKIRGIIGDDAYIPTIYDLIAPSGSKALFENHPKILEAFNVFNNARGQQSQNLYQGYAEYKREILKWNAAKVKSVNDNGGLRIFSYSDFEAHHLIDLVQIIQDCAVKGVAIQGYTKVPAFARVVENTNIKLNRSLIPLGDTGIKDGELAFDPVEGIDINEPNFKESTDNVGNVLIGINDKQIRMAMADPRIHYIIPFHSNQAIELIIAKGCGAWTNYKFEQREYQKTGGAAKNGVNIYTDVLNAAEAEGNPIKNEKQFVEKFLQVCKERDLIPRFARFLDKDANGNYVYTPGYYKLLIDFKLFNENGKILPQKPVVANFDDAFNAKILEEYVAEERAKLTEGYSAKWDAVYNEIKDALNLNPDGDGNGIRFADRTDYSDMLVKAAEEKAGKGLKVQKGRSLEASSQNTENEESTIRFRVVEDPEEIAWFEESPKLTGYRNLVQLPDGSLRPPMADALRGNGITIPMDGFKLGEIIKSEETPEIVKENGKVDLVKPNGLGDVKDVDYNPYNHHRHTLVNSQFDSAWERPNLVFVECEIPVADIETGYQADKAALPVGDHPWNGGNLILSRYSKAVGIVPWERVAEDWVDQFKDTGVNFNKVPPKLLPILAERGVEILPPIGGMGKACNDAYEAWKREGLVVGDNSLVGIHNISAEKLLKAINMGGLANPSAAVVDVNTGSHEGYGAISLILPSSKVSKKTGKNAGTWMGDAYTPTYPSIEKHMTDAGEAKKVADLRNLPDDIRPLVRKSIDAWIDGSASYQDGLMYMFLVENDMTPKTIYKGGKYSAELVDKVGELLGGEYSLRNADSEVLPKVLDEYIASQYNGDRAAYEEAFARRTAHLEKGLQSDRPFMRHRSQEALSLNEKYGFDYNSVQSWLNELGYESRTRGEVDDYRMIEDMRKTVDENGMRNEYIEWLDNLEKRYDIQERIFKGFNARGDRKYIPHTLENVSKEMKKEGKNGTQSGGSFANFTALMLPKKQELAGIREYKHNLHGEHEATEAFRDKWTPIYLELGEKLQKGDSGFVTYGFERLAEAAQEIVKGRDANSYLKKEYGVQLSEKDINQLKEMINAIQTEYPTMYFETKFERPVRLNEFASAVIPEGTSQKIINALEEAGLKIETYDSNVEGSRQEAVRRASEGEGIRFREGGMPWNEGESLMDALDRNYKRKSKLEIAVANMERKRDAGRSIDEDEYNAMKAELTKIREDIRFMQNGPTQPTLQHGETIYDESFANRMEAWREDLAAWKDKKYDADVMLDQLLQSTTGERATMTDEELREILEAESDKIDATIKETKTLIKDQIISRVSNIGVRYWDDVVKVKDIKSKTTAEERKLMPHLLEGSYDIIPNKGEMYHEYVEERKANNPDLIELGEYDDVSTDVAVYDAPATGNKYGIKHSDVIDYAVEGSTKVFTIEPYQHTRRDGRVRDMYTISFGRKLSKNEVEQANSYLAEHKAGWHRASINGFVVRDEDVARAIANLLSGGESITNTLRKVWVGKGNHGMIEFEDGTFFPLYPFDMEYLAWRESKGASVPKEMMSDVEESLLNQFLHNEIETYLPNGIRDFMDVKYIDAHTLDVMNEVREWYDDLWYEMEALGMNFGKGKRDFYVTHIWDKKKSTPTSITTAQKFALATKPKDIVDVESYVATNTPYMRTRMFDSLLDGMALGLVPKYEDIADIILDYGHRAAEAIENRKMVKFLKMLTVNGIPALREVGGRNEGIYTVINNNALRGYEVLKDVKPMLNVIFGPTHSSESAGWQAVGKGYDIVGGLAKKIELSLSFFHHGALTETAIAMNGPFRTMKIVGKHLMWDCIKNGDIPAFNDPELTRDAVKHLVVLGATQDYATKDVQMATEKIVEWTRKIHGVHEAAKLVDFINKGSDKILWDYLHDGLKVYAYEKMAKEIRARAERKGIENETLEKMLNEAGQLVNDTFGGQHFELLGWSPKTVKWMRRLLLSPDWTMSTIRQALAPVGIGQLYNDDGFWKKYFKDDDVASVRKQYGRAFWLRAALFAIPLVTGINMCNRLEDEEEQKAIADEKRKTDPNYLSPYEMAYPDGMKWYDYTMYGNTVGHSTHLFMGRYEDGSEQYLRWGKQFRELPELIFGPDGFGFPDPLIHKMVGKLNPMVDAFINLMSGNSFTGWVNEDMKDKEGWDKNLGRLTYLGKKFIPFAWNLDATTEFKPIDLLMPSTKGFSRGKAIKQFKVAIMNDDKDYAKLVMDACKMNGLNGDQLLETAWKVLEAEGRKNMVEGVETVDDAISQYDAEANPERREQLKYFIMRQMSLRDIRMISNEQAVEQAWNTLMTAGDNSKADKVYNTINSSEDVLQDWRMSRVMAELKPFKAEYNKQETYDEAEAYYNEHKAEIDKYEDLLEARRYINEYKRAMGNDADNAELLRLIREERKKALGIKEN